MKYKATIIKELDFSMNSPDAELVRKLINAQKGLVTCSGDKPHNIGDILQVSTQVYPYEEYITYTLNRDVKPPKEQNWLVRKVKDE